jgi:hypothetical protein
MESFKAFIAKMNELGIPAPMIRDPKTGRGSVTLTLVVVSGGIVAIGLLNSFANVFKGIDMTNALYWHGLALGAYLGRKMSAGNGKVSIDSKKEE